ncbi:ABC transporter permease [Anthocerotibacter panamensis]|uniref:ABC transporter permease n=1 Tax=Anthocerotibacter panamensis TaxID=2857077 RepID=UPI001C408693|nr:ABC transporter permease [Anthocerotibacter panamensis]
MPWIESLLVSARTLWANRVRSFLTMLGLIIGIGSVILMLALGVGTQKFVEGQFKGLGTKVVFVREDQTPRPGRRPVTLSDVQALATQISAVQDAAPLVRDSNGRAIWGSRNTTGTIYGTTANAATMLNFIMVKGRFFTEQEVIDQARVIILGEQVSQDLFKTEEPIGKEILVNNQAVTVIGITRRGGFGGFIDRTRGLVMPLTTVQARLVGSSSPFGQKVTGAFLEAKPSEQVDAIMFQATNLMRQRHQIATTDDFTIGSPQNTVDIFNGITAGLTIFLGLTATISLIVGGINIMNIMLVSVTERTREIGLRKALGASEGAILVQFVLEAVLISLLGGVVGVLLGTGLAGLIALASPLKAEVTTLSVILAAGVSILIGLFFGVVPARRAAKLDPIVALRTE